MPDYSAYTFLIATVKRGFFDGFNPPVAIGSVVSISAIMLWILVFPEQSTAVLAEAKAYLLTGFRGWFLYSVAAFLVAAAFIAIAPISGTLRLAKTKSARPSFSTASWLSMMFCGGIGAGIVAYAVAEPMSHLATNPELIAGTLQPDAQAAAQTAVKYAFLHWGLSAWAIYSIMGLAIGLFSFRYGLPLTIRTIVAPLLGRRLEGVVGHLIDSFAIVAIVAGVATTMGYGSKTLSSGVNYLAGGSLLADAPNHVPTLLIALIACAILAAVAVIAGVGRGMKWISNTGTTLFFVVLVYFGLHASPEFLVATGFGALSDYITQLPSLSLSVFGETKTETDIALSTWQTDWTIFYWTWWLAFAPFVSLFIARISEGRTVREFVLGSALAPCGVCFAWFAATGSASIGLELASEEYLLLGRDTTEQLFVAISLLNGSFVGEIFTVLAFVLIFILASATFASGVLAITTIAAAGDNSQKPAKHIILWVVVCAAIIGALLAAGGTASIRDVMVISALPISGLMVLAVLSIGWVLFTETRYAAKEKAHLAGVEQREPNTEAATVRVSD